MQQKLETRLAIYFIEKLRQECSDDKERIKILKIHGSAFQPMGISDYIGWYKGKGLAIEFKVHPNELTPIQEDFLESVVKTGNIGMVVTFKKQLIEKESDPYILLLTAYNLSRNNAIFYCDVNYGN